MSLYRGPPHYTYQLYNNMLTNSKRKSHEKAITWMKSDWKLLHCTFDFIELLSNSIDEPGCVVVNENHL